MNNQIFILIFVIVVFVLGGLLYIYNPEPTEYVNPDEMPATSTPVFEDGTIW